MMSAPKIAQAQLDAHRTFAPPIGRSPEWPSQYERWRREEERLCRAVVQAVYDAETIPSVRTCLTDWNPWLVTT